MNNSYTAYALGIDSELPLPELLANQSDNIDVTIRFGAISEDLPDYPVGKQRIWKAEPGKFSMSVKNIGRFTVLQGTEIIISPYSGASEDDLRFVLLGSILGALLHQRNILALHASSVQTPHGAILFMGPSGYGKSTLAATFSQRGYGILSDDTIAIQLNGEAPPIALPSFPRIRLWSDSATELNYSSSDLQPMRVGTKKYLAPIGDFVSESSPILGMYVLDRHQKPTIELSELTGIQKFTELRDNTYRRNFLPDLGLTNQHYQQTMQLAKRVKMSRVTRPIDSFQPHQLAERLEMDWKTT